MISLFSPNTLFFLLNVVKAAAYLHKKNTLHQHFDTSLSVSS